MFADGFAWVVLKSSGASLWYSMIIWNWNKVNSYISALKPLPRVPKRSKWPWCWDILIFETSGTSTSFGKCQWFYKCTIYIDEIWVESTTRYLWKHGYTLQQPPKHPKTIKKPPPGTPDTPPVPQEQRWLLPNTHETFWEAFKLSRDVRENSGRRKSVRRCLLSVWNVCDCLTLLWENSMASQESYMRVWGYLGLSWGCWTV